MRRENQDAIVIGSGITGGWAAKELCRHGLDTLVLERGPWVTHGRDYLTEHKPDSWFPYRGLGDRRAELSNQSIQRACSSYTEASAQFFANDRDNPYTHDPDKPFSWIRGQQLGGRSLLWYRQCYRWSDLDFEANRNEAIAVDWPIRYSDLAPWYDYVERYIGVSGKAEGLPQLPDGAFLPPMPMNVAEDHARRVIADRFPGRIVTPGRTATLTRPHNGRAPCHFCGPCERGCSVGAYFSSLSATLPDAMATKRLTIRTDSIVHSLIYDRTHHRVSGVRCIDARTKRVTEYFARVVFLCASAMESVRILLNSADGGFPEGLANSSGTLGTHIMDHQWGVGASGELPDLARSGGYRNGFRPSVTLVPRFRNVAEQDSPFRRGYHLECAGWRPGWRSGFREAGIGEELKRRLMDPGPWSLSFAGAGECLPYRDNAVRINPAMTDAWGVPVLHFSFSYRENEASMRKDIAQGSAEMLEAAGAKNINQTREPLTPGLSVHEMGGARMGRDPKTSVLNGFNQSHDLSNLFITDGSCMTSSGNQNPSLTYMALTARACDYAVRRLRSREIR
jgi:choline dehydrogenase-like flavoprotein